MKIKFVTMSAIRTSAFLLALMLITILGKSQGCVPPGISAPVTGCAQQYTITATTHNLGVTYFYWYSTASGGTPFKTDSANPNVIYNPSTFATTLSATTTFWVSVYCNGAETARTPWTFTLGSLTINTSSNNVPIGTNVTLSSGDLGNYNWYKGSSNGYPLATGTPSVVVTTGGTYYANVPSGCQASVSVNYLPVADAGQNYTIASGTSFYEIFGSAYDPEGQPITYKWTLPPSTIAISTTSTLTLGSPPVGTYIYQLEVKDPSNVSILSSMTLTVISIPNNYNSITTEDILIPNQTTVGMIGSLVNGQKGVSTDYLNGLGQVNQVVYKQASPSNFDLLVPYEYDDLGRSKKSFLPIATTSTTGNFHTNETSGDYTLTEHYKFYNGVGINVPQDSKPYSDKIFASDPLGRVVQQGSPGSAWQPGVVNGYKANAYGTNNGTSAYTVRSWTTNTGTLPLSTGVYDINTLNATTQTDEAGITTIHFTNREGLKVLSRVQSSTNSSFFADTYFVYDSQNQLRFVLPPEFSKLYPASGSVNVVQSDVDKWCQQMLYDVKGRVIQTKGPGIGWSNNVYDSRDRSVLNQDPQQAINNEWNYTKYDAFNRPVITGLYHPGTLISQTQMQATIDGQANNLGYQNVVTTFTNGVSAGLDFILSSYQNINEYRAVNSVSIEPGFVFIAGTTASSFRASIDNGSGTDGLAVNVFPFTNTTDLTVTYYDGYDNCQPCSNSNLQFSPDTFLQTSIDNQAFVPVNNILGKIAGTNVRILGSATWLTTVNYYNWQGSIIQTSGLNHLGGNDRASFLYDFNGVVMEELTSMHGYNSGGINALRRQFIYDVSGRSLKVYHQINNQPKILKSSISYNELGHEVRINLHSTDVAEANFIQSVDFRSNIRDWLTNINNLTTGDDTNDFFGMDFTYNGNVPSPGTSSAGNIPRTDGAISGIRWKQDLTTKHRLYNFSYDGFCRLNGASYKADYNSILQTQTDWNNQTDFFSENNITYDLNGNLLSLNRYNEYFNGALTADPVDQLSYSYTTFGGNQIDKVVDASTSPNHLNGFADGTNTGSDYSYDANGSMTQDLNKKISIISYYYNHLPNKITFTDNSYLQYLYDAVGTKLNVSYYNAANQFQSSKDYVGSLVFGRSITDPTPVFLSVSEKDGRIVGPTYANLFYNNDAASSDGWTTIGSVQTNSYFNSVTKDNYVTLTCNQTGGTAGISSFRTSAGASTYSVKSGESYVFKVLGFQSVGTDASLYITTNTGDLIWPGPAIQLSGNENWVSSYFTIPTGVTWIQLGLKWISPVSGNTVYVNKIALYKTDFEYQYFLLDHQETPRAVLQTNPHTDVYVATMEPQNQCVESGNNCLTLGGAATFNNLNTSSTFAVSSANHTANGTYAIRMNASYQAGPSKGLQVYPGDIINASVWSYYPSGYSYTKTAAATMAGIIAKALTGYAVGGIGDPGSASGTGYAYSGSNSSIVMSPNKGSSAPSAFLNYLLFDKDFNILAGQSVPIPSNPNTLAQIAIPSISIQELGTMYVYLSYDNDSGGDVYFDDFTISQQQSALIQVSNNYPFGLENSPWTRISETPNNFLFQGQELNAQTGLLEFASRAYNPELGRWFAADPKNQFSSPYLSMGNRPHIGRDEDGEWYGYDDLIVCAIGFVIGDVSYAATGKGGGGVIPRMISPKAVLAGAEGAAIAEAGYLTMGGGLALEGTGAAATLGSTEFATQFGVLYAANAGMSLLEAGGAGDLSGMSSGGTMEAIAGYEGVAALQSGFQSDWMEDKVDLVWGKEAKMGLFKGVSSDMIGGAWSGLLKGEVGHGFSWKGLQGYEALSQAASGGVSKFVANGFDKLNDLWEGSTGKLGKQSIKRQGRAIAHGFWLREGYAKSESILYNFVFSAGKEMVSVYAGQAAANGVRILEKRIQASHESYARIGNYEGAGASTIKDGIDNINMW